MIELIATYGMYIFLVFIYSVCFWAFEALLLSFLNPYANWSLMTPARLYEYSDLNIVGSWIVFLFFRLINPVSTILALLYLLFTYESEE